MPTTFEVRELADSRTEGRGTSRFVDVGYYVRVATLDTDDPADESTAYDAVISGTNAPGWGGAPAAVNSWPLRGARVEPVNGFNQWRVRLRYEPIGARGETPTPASTGSGRTEFDAAGGTVNVTDAITETRYPPSADTMNAQINVTDEGAQGVDIEREGRRWVERHYYANASVTWGGLNAIADQLKTVNDAAFRGFAAGEVFFKAFRAAPRSDEDWEFVFEFEASPNLTNQTVAGITGVAKGGWDYLWIRYQRTDGDDSLAAEPLAVYVNQVYPSSDFSALGIGTGDPPL